MSTQLTRRQTIRLLSGTLALPFLTPPPALGNASPVRVRPVPASGESLPVIGMGTWRTFNVGSDPGLRQARTQVLATFFERGGRVIDCSPMYGSSADVLGDALNRLSVPSDLFAAEKVWTGDGSATAEQVTEQRQEWDIERFDLMQIHNLLSWREHLRNLRDMKESGKIRYIGITTSHGRRHGDLEQIMASEPLDFVQLTYNITHREAEQRLLPLAQDKGIAVIANRPFDGGYLIKRLKRDYQVPDWAAQECDCQSWAEFLLKFIVSQPSITCAIPATTRISHMQENMDAIRGELPDAQLRRRMARHIESL